MNRLQKKCVLASAGLHSLLVLVLLVGPAFLTSRDQSPDLAVLDVIPAKLVDEAFSGGGTPNAKPPPPAPLVKPESSPPAPKPQPTPAPKPQPVVKPEPAPPKPAPAPDFSAKPTPAKRLPDVSTDLITRKPDSRTKLTTTADADERKRAKAEMDERRIVFAGALNKIGDLASSSTEVEIPGPGGEAYANYSQVLKSVYTHAWLVPTDARDDATAIVKVVIARSGNVISADIIRSSGDALVDASVRRALDRVPSVAPFPAGSKDDKRDFTFSFTPKNKRQL